MPESPSEELAVTSKLPAPVGRKKTLFPAADVVPVKFAKLNDGALGSDVSTFTVEEIETLLPTLSTPVSVYR